MGLLENLSLVFKISVLKNLKNLILLIFMNLSIPQGTTAPAINKSKFQDLSQVIC